MSYFMVSFDKLSDLRERIEKLSERYKEDSGELKEIIVLLQECWRGEASDQYAKQLVEINQLSDTTATVLGEMGKLLEDVIKTYSESEQEKIDNILKDLI